VNAAFGELYAYDNLNQLTSMDRGTLNGTKTGLTCAASRSQSWDFDALGNWDSVTTDGSAQTRSHNKQNEITSVSGLTTPTYDASGNLTKDETGRTFEFDAWNRLVRAKNSGGTTIAEYKYDALSRRVSETKSGSTTDFYYSASWQVLEERVGGNATVQYTWSPVYVDALILRDRDTDANGSLDERLWVQQDANFNVTALVNGSGVVVERFAYDAFGNFTVYDASWTLRGGGSAYSWLHYHQGLRYDATVSLYDNRWRWYDADLGRFTSNDPLRFGAGDVNFVRYVGNSSTGFVDPFGLDGDPIEKGPYGWIASITMWYCGGNELRKPIPRDSCSGTETVNNLQAGDSMERQNKLWADDATHKAGLVIVGTIIVVGSIFFPGPEDVVFGALLTRRGISVIGRGARRILKRGGKEITEAEARILRSELEILSSTRKGPGKWASSQVGTTGGNSKLLRRNLGLEDGCGLDAHHIVESTGLRADPARRILDKYQVDINDAVNGIALKPSGSRPAHHGQGLHSNLGIDAVSDRLRQATRNVNDWATARQALLDELDAIRREIINGTFP